MEISSLELQFEELFYDEKGDRIPWTRVDLRSYRKLLMLAMPEFTSEWEELKQELGDPGDPKQVIEINIKKRLESYGAEEQPWATLLESVSGDPIACLQFRTELINVFEALWKVKVQVTDGHWDFHPYELHGPIKVLNTADLSSYQVSSKKVVIEFDLESMPRDIENALGHFRSFLKKARRDYKKGELEFWPETRWSPLEGPRSFTEADNRVIDDDHRARLKRVGDKLGVKPKLLAQSPTSMEEVQQLIRTLTPDKGRQVLQQGAMFCARLFSSSRRDKKLMYWASTPLSMGDNAYEFLRKIESRAENGTEAIKLIFEKLDPSLCSEIPKIQILPRQMLSPISEPMVYDLKLFRLIWVEGVKQREVPSKLSEYDRKGEEPCRSYTSISEGHSSCCRATQTRKTSPSSTHRKSEHHTWCLHCPLAASKNMTVRFPSTQCRWDRSACRFYTKPRRPLKCLR